MTTFPSGGTARLSENEPNSNSEQHMSFLLEVIHQSANNLVSFSVLGI